jgi:UDP-glucose 4-epimerase
MAAVCDEEPAPSNAGRDRVTRILVTGGAGYVGSHVALALLEDGFEVVVLDDLSTGERGVVPPAAEFRHGGAGDAALLDAIFAERDIDAVVHLAASTSAPESVEHPEKYYANNVTTTETLVSLCLRHGVGAFLFSSSAAVYGVVDHDQVGEECETRPCNPYGVSKLMAERALLEAARRHPGFRPICLRYFNVAGADPLGRAGPVNPAATSLFKAAIDTALGRRRGLEIFGRDYPTRDGTCERDFIHVDDLALAHVLGMRHLLAGGGGTVFNCGYGRGYTVLEVIAALETLIGRGLPVAFRPRRPGDPARSVSDATRLRQALGWRPRRDSLEAMLGSALQWAARAR